MTLPGAFLSLLIAVVGALLVGPLLDTGPRAVIDQALFSAVLIAAVVSVRRQRGQLIAAAPGALVAVGLGWAALVTGDDSGPSQTHGHQGAGGSRDELARSEEHTSELQSPPHLVFRLL